MAWLAVPVLKVEHWAKLPLYWLKNTLITQLHSPLLLLEDCSRICLCLILALLSLWETIGSRYHEAFATACVSPIRNEMQSCCSCYTRSVSSSFLQWVMFFMIRVIVIISNLFAGGISKSHHYNPPFLSFYLCFYHVLKLLFQAGVGSFIMVVSVPHLKTFIKS